MLSNRNLPKQFPEVEANAVLPANMRGRSGLRIQFCIRTLRMFLVRGGEDWIYRLDASSAKEQEATWNKRFDQWLSKSEVEEKKDDEPMGEPEDIPVVATEAVEKIEGAPVVSTA